MKYTKNKLIDIGISKLKNFGFVNVTRENVFEDEVYKYYFKLFMNSIKTQSQDIEPSIEELLSTIDKKNER